MTSLTFLLSKRLPTCSCIRLLSTAASTSTSTNSNGPIPSTSKSAGIPPVKRSFYELPLGLVLTGLVTATGRASKTSTVTVASRVEDHKTLKIFTTHKKYLVHDEHEVCAMGDKVSIRNCRPVSKRKRFELLKVLASAEGTDVTKSKPVEVVETEAV